MAWYHKLPLGYVSKEIWDKIPPWVNMSEHILRTCIFLMPLILKLSLEKASQKMGLWIYLVGLLIYLSSWLWQIYFPNSSWSSSMLGFMAPAYTILLPLLGIGLIGQASFMHIPRLGMIYIILSLAFVLVHTYHAFLAYKNLNL